MCFVKEPQAYLWQLNMQKQMRFHSDKIYNEEGRVIEEGTLVNTNIYEHGKEKKAVSVISMCTLGIK